MDNGYKVHLANPAGIQKDKGLKYKYLAWAFPRRLSSSAAMINRPGLFITGRPRKKTLWWHTLH